MVCYSRRTRPNPLLIQTCTLLEHVEDGQERFTATQTESVQVYFAASVQIITSQSGPNDPELMGQQDKRFLLKVPAPPDSDWIHNFRRLRIK